MVAGCKAEFENVPKLTTGEKELRTETERNRELISPIHVITFMII